jgi:hypothetical protein
MGNRISIQFKQGKDVSPVLFSHWDGEDFVEIAKTYIKELKAEIKKNNVSGSDPLTRFEPQTVLVDFIRYITEGKGRVTGNYYLGVNECDGDNSDNGHFVIDLPARKDRYA